MNPTNPDGLVTAPITPSGSDASGSWNIAVAQRRCAPPAITARARRRARRPRSTQRRHLANTIERLACETSNYVPTASFSIVMGPETTAVLDDRATALRQRLFRARETTYRIDADKLAATMRRFHAALRALARGARHAEASTTTMNDDYATIDGHATQVAQMRISRLLSVLLK